MSILKRFIRKFSNKQNKIIPDIKEFEVNDNRGEVSQVKYQDISKANSDVCDGMQFTATCHLSTPLFVLKRHGEIFRGNGSPPSYGEPRDGIWIPKLKSKFDFLSEGRTTASDAGHVNSDEYISYAIGLLSIFDTDESIHKKMDDALNYSKGNEKFQDIESKITQYYKKRTIADVMCLFINANDKKDYQLNKHGYLTSINGINQVIAKSLESLGVKTINDLKLLKKDDLLKVKGVGKIKADKILSDLENYAD